MMSRWILNNWLILAITCFLVGVYIGIFESFWKDKGWLYILLAGAFAALYYFRRKKAKS